MWLQYLSSDYYFQLGLCKVTDIKNNNNNPKEQSVYAVLQSKLIEKVIKMFTTKNTNILHY